METLITDFNSGKVRRRSPEDGRLASLAGWLNKKIKQEENPELRAKLLDRKKALQRRQWAISSKDQQDPDFRRLRYGRYADDFVLTAICPKSEAEAIYKKGKNFLKDELKFSASQTKSGLKHNTEIIRFLGYDLTIQHCERTVKTVSKGQHCKIRTMKAQTALHIPESKLPNFAKKHGYGHWETMKATHRRYLSQWSDAEITLHYSAEMRGIAQYYALADNFARLNRLRFLWIQSYLKTMANK